MTQPNEILIDIITKFSESGWDLIDAPSSAWLEALDDEDLLKQTAAELIPAIEQADTECGSCGCEYDPLYKEALKLLRSE